MRTPRDKATISSDPRFPIGTVRGAVIGLALAGAPASLAAVSSEQLEFFESKVRPLLAEHCYACHSAKIETPFAGLRLDSREAILQGGDSGPAIVPGRPAQSLVIKALKGEPVLMPPGGGLPKAATRTLEEWIRMGAPWPEERISSESEAGGFDLAQRKRAHWAWQPVHQADPPQVKKRRWPLNPVDRFVLAELEEHGMLPAPTADRRTLIRRLSYDLTGMPPTPDETAHFVQDDDPDAYQKLVRRLLDSQRFGEHWARHWMDLVRYADSHGSEGDPAIPNAWHYRDYLVRALNADVPYDQLVREHLAGDVLDEPRIAPDRGINESILGTAHLRLVELGYQPVDPWEERVKWTDNQIDVFSKAFLGLTVACARCHDHKFDAISQQDYYALFGALYGARPTMRAVDSPASLRLHSKRLGKLKDQIRERVADQWIKDAASLPSRLKRADGSAIRAALEEAACDDTSPLHAFLQLGDLRGDRLWEAVEELRADWHSRMAARKTFNERNFQEIWDLSGADYDKWVSHGAGVSETPSTPGEFRVALEGNTVLHGIYPGGVYTHLLSSKHAGVMQSPRFKIDTDYVSVRTLGHDFSFARLIVENYSLPLGGIYDQRYSPRADTMRWWQFKTEFWKGFTGYIEFATREDATNFRLDSIDRAKDPRPERPTHGRSGIGAAAVAFHNGKRQPKSTTEPILHLLAAEPSGSADSLGDVLAERLAAAATAWRDDTIDRPRASFLDYFARRGLVATSIDEIEGADELVAEYRRLESEIAVPQRFPGVVEESAPDHPLLVRGDPRKPADPVQRRFLEAIGSERYADPAAVRRSLAEDVTKAENPLTARVMANRVWQSVFGRGIVATPDNFGVLGDAPSHPELLDYVAARFVAEGWSIKRLVELLVTSRTYRMSSTASAKSLERDPSNSLLQHMPVRRLEAEAIRDTLLAVSGQLDSSMYGPPPPSRNRYDEHEGPGSSIYGDDRRSVYQEIRRNRTNPFLEVFDQPTPSTTRGRRDVTNVPAQSLALMNSPFVLGSAYAWGRRLADGEGHSVGTRVEYMYRKALGRPPSPEERRDAVAFVTGLAEEEGAKDRDILASADTWGRFAHTLFNFKEFLYVR